MKKLIFFDIDGTIIPEYENCTIPESFMTTLHTLRQNGHLCFVNTGRAFAEVDRRIRELPFDGFVCGCGTYIEYLGKVLLSHTIPAELGNEIIRHLDICRLEWLLEGTHEIYYSSHTYHTRIELFRQEHLRLLPDACRIVTPEEAKDLSFDKFCICLGKNHDFETFHGLYQDSLTFIDRGNNFYEIVPKGFSKASGIAFLESFFGIPNKDTIAIGDSTNDLAMLNYAGYSIAMGNSSRELFPIADYITDSVVDDGICHAMRHLGLI